MWQRSRQDEADRSRCEDAEGAVAQASLGLRSPADRQGNSLPDNQRIRQAELLSAQQCRCYLWHTRSLISYQPASAPNTSIAKSLKMFPLAAPGLHNNPEPDAGSFP